MCGCRTGVRLEAGVLLSFMRLDVVAQEGRSGPGHEGGGIS